MVTVLTSFQPSPRILIKTPSIETFITALSGSGLSRHRTGSSLAGALTIASASAACWATTCPPYSLTKRFRLLLQRGSLVKPSNRAAARRYEAISTPKLSACSLLSGVQLGWAKANCSSRGKKPSLPLRAVIVGSLQFRLPFQIMLYLSLRFPFILHRGATLPT